MASQPGRYLHHVTPALGDIENNRGTISVPRVVWTKFQTRNKSVLDKTSGATVVRRVVETNNNICNIEIIIAEDAHSF